MRVAFVENNDSFSRNVLDLLPVDPSSVDVVSGVLDSTRPGHGARARGLPHREVLDVAASATTPPKPLDSCGSGASLEEPLGTSAARLLGRLEGADVVIVGPGPRDPVRAGLVEVVAGVLARGTPLLGICLGHQALGVALGARLVRARPSHGKLARARFVDARLFPGFDGAYAVMRYHSLSLVDVPPPLRTVATSDDGTVMAVEHESLPAAGLQFHPDSHGTPEGRRMIEAFFRAVA